MAPVFDKPFLRYDQLIRLMRSRNLVINDEQFAKSVLSNMSYYTIINGYKDSALSVPGSDLFIPGTQFEELYTLHIIDVSISHLVLKHILYIERSLKSKMSYLISRKYGVFTDVNDMRNANPADYLCKQYYSNSNGSRNNTLRAIKTTMDVSNPHVYHSKGLEHYLIHHNHVPAWILTTSLSFGQTLRWYRIFRADDKTNICNSFLQNAPASMTDQDKKEFLIKALDLLKEFRNMVAHEARTFRSTGQAAIPKQQVIDLSSGIISAADYNSNVYAQTGLYAVIAAIMILMNDPYLKSSFVLELENILGPYHGITINGSTICSLFNLPDDITVRIKKAVI